MEPLVWDRPDPGPRTAPVPLSRDAIVAAAVELADRDGLDGVSLRKVGAALGAGPMRLYGYVATKDELLEVMVDAVYGELDLPAAGADWRSAVRAIALATREAALRHPWFAGLHSGRPNVGPHALRHLEALLAALGRAPGRGGIDAALAAAGAVQSYVLGALTMEVAGARGPTREQWQRNAAGYMQRMLETGEFPQVGRLIVEADHPEAPAAFEGGLDMVLAGIAAV